MDLKSRIEALLYATEYPLSISDISIMLMVPKDDVAKSMKQLIREYAKRETSLTIARNGVRYKMQLKDEFVEDVMPVTEREFTKVELNILGYIAANPNCKKGDLNDSFGEKYKEVVDNLKKKRLIASKKYRNTEVYRVSKRFYSYFNVNKEKLESLIERPENGENND